MKRLSFLLLFAASAFAQIWGVQPSPSVDSSLKAWYSLSPDYNNTGHVLNVDTSTHNLAGLTMYDYSNNGNNATYTGLTAAAYYGTYGAYPLMAEFGASGYGSVAMPSLPIPANVTVSIWGAVPSAMTGGYARMIELGNSSGGLFVGGDSTNTHYLVTVGNYSGGYGSCSGGVIDTNWHMVTATFDGANAYLYVDAIQVAGPCSFTLGTQSVTTGVIGGSWGTGTAGGVLGDARVYNRLLSRTADMIQMYSSGAQGFSLKAATWVP